MPPAALISSIAVMAPKRHCPPLYARKPVTGCTRPTLMVFDCARNKVGTPNDAAAAAPAPRKVLRRRGLLRKVIGIAPRSSVLRRLAGEGRRHPVGRGVFRAGAARADVGRLLRPGAG